MPVGEEIVAGPWGTKDKLVQSDWNDWHKEHTASDIDHHNLCRSEHLTAAKQAQISHWISAVMTHELQ